MLNNFSRKHLFILLLILFVYFISRIVSLNNFPIFTDEAIYIRWAQIAKNDAAWRFISLTDGKQPIFIWLTIGMMKIIKDPLIAGRLVSVFSGAGTIITLFLLGKVIFNKWETGLLASFFYLISPFSFVYDRIALMDSTLAFIMTLALLFEFLFIKTLRLDVALLLGGIIGFGSLTKTSGFIALYMLPFLVLLLDWQHQNRIKMFLKFVLLSFIILLISQGMYFILRLSPFFHIIAQKDTTFLYSFSDWLSHPFTFFQGNLNGLMDWVVRYLTIPFSLLTLLGIFAGKNYFKERLFIFVWFFIPLVGLALFGKVIFPRFIFFMVVPLFLLTSYSLIYLSQKIKFKFTLYILLILISFLPLSLAFQLMTKPTEAKIPPADSNQYYNFWPSGWGIAESVKYFQKQAQKGKIAVYTEGDFGLLPAGLEIYLWNNKNVYIKGLWPVPEKPPQEVIDNAKKIPTFIIFFQYSPPPAWKLEEVLKVRKGNSERYHYVYQVQN